MYSREKMGKADLTIDFAFYYRDVFAETVTHSTLEENALKCIPSRVL